MARDETQNPEGATVDSLATEQKRRWSSGDAVTVEELLREFDHPALDVADLAQLAHAEYEFRQSMGEDYDVDALFTRFPQCAEHLRRLLSLPRPQDRPTPGSPETILEFSPQVNTAADACNDPQIDGEDDESDAAQTIDGTGEDQDFSADIVTGATVIDTQPSRLLETRLTPGTTSIVQTFVTPSESQADRFELKDEIARGGMGRIVHAYDERIRRDVAYKELLPRCVKSRESRSRFVEEAQITGQLEHSGVVPIYEMGVNDEGAPYYVMKLVRGETFEDAIQTWHRMSESDPHRRVAFNALLRRFIDICNTLGFAHDNGVLHRDLKPQNVMLGEFGETLVLDWGLAKVIAGDAKSDAAPAGEQSDADTDLDEDDSIRAGASGPVQDFGATLNSSGPPGSDTSIPKVRGDSYMARTVSTDERLTQTRHGSILGTPAYMSPEQARGRHDRLDARSDVYALGAILYRLLTDQTPVGKQRSARAALRATRDGQVTPPREVRPQIPRPLEAICLQAMQRDVADRYQSAMDLKNDVEAWLADEPISVYQEPLPQRAWRFIKRHRFAVAVSAAVLFTAIVVPVAVRTYDEIEATESVNGLIAQADAAEAAQKFVTAQTLLANAEGEASKQPGLSELARNISNRRRRLEAQLREQADDARKEAVASRNQAVENSLLAETRRLVAESRSAQAEKPRLSLLLAGEAVELSRRTGREVVPEAVQNLHDVIGRFGGRGLHQHTGPIRTVAISADGQWMLSGSADQRARLWRLDDTGDSVELSGHVGAVTAVLFTPNERYAVTAGDDGDVVLWNVDLDRRPRPVHAMLEDNLPVTCMAVSPDSRWLAASGFSADIRIWDLTADKPGSTLKRLKEHSDTVNTLQFSPDGRTLFSGSDDKVVAAWSIPVSDEPPDPPRLMTGHAAGITTLDLSEDGMWLASGDAEGDVRVWKTDAADASADPIVLTRGRHAVVRVRFAPDAGLIAVATTSGECSVWEMAESEWAQVARFSDHTAPINDMLWLASPLRVVTASDDRTVHIRNWPSELDSSGTTLRIHEDSVWALAASAVGDTLAGGALDGAIQVWDTARVAPGMTPGLVNGHDRQVRELAVSHDGRWLVSISTDRSRTAQLWRHNGRLRVEQSDAFATELESLGRVTTAAWHPTRSLFAIGTSEGQVSVLNPSDPAGSRRVLNGLAERVNDIVFSPSGDQIAASADGGHLAIWDVSAAGAAPLQSLRVSSDDLTCLAFASDGKAVAIGDDGGGVYVLLSGADAATLLPGSHERAVNQIAFSPDGRWLGSVSDDRSLRLWNWPRDSSSESSPQIQVRHTDKIYSLVFAPDSRHVLTTSDGDASDDEVVIKWPLESSDPEQDAVILTGHSKGVRCMALTNQGRMVATGSDDETLRLWDLGLDNPSAASILFRNFGESVRSLAVDETSATLFVGTTKGRIAVWPLGIETLIQAASKTSGRPLTESEQIRFQPDLSAFGLTAGHE